MSTSAGIIGSSPDLATATRHCNVVLHPCNSCREAVYCSRTCQKKDWCRHKPRCIIVKGAHDLLRAYAEGPALSGMPCEHAGEEEVIMPKLRLIHLECPSAQTLKDVRDKNKLLAPGGVDVDVQYCPVAEVAGQCWTQPTEAKRRRLWEQPWTSRGHMTCSATSLSW
jgi:hypothetical protein